VEFHTPHFREVSNVRLDPSGRIAAALQAAAHKPARAILSTDSVWKPT
jgi:hypothetical protein